MCCPARGRVLSAAARRFQLLPEELPALVLMGSDHDFVAPCIKRCKNCKSEKSCNILLTQAQFTLLMSKHSNAAVSKGKQLQVIFNTTTGVHLSQESQKLTSNGRSYIARISDTLSLCSWKARDSSGAPRQHMAASLPGLISTALPGGAVKSVGSDAA